jgi:pyridoxamine 5'-phosphate oxidase
MPLSDDSNPIDLFNAWLKDAEATEPRVPEAVTVATVDATGMPSIRTVLLKGSDERGFVFYTNLASLKSQQLMANPQAALSFHWKTLKRQVNIQGTVEPVSDAEADAYFASRPRDSQIGAWASKQSQPLTGRMELEKRVAKYALKFGVGAVPRPPFWSGFRVAPTTIEFWEDKRFRLHERLLFRRTADGWDGQWLYP